MLTASCAARRPTGASAVEHQQFAGDVVGAFEQLDDGLRPRRRPTRWAHGRALRAALAERVEGRGAHGGGIQRVWIRPGHTTFPRISGPSVRASASDSSKLMAPFDCRVALDHLPPAKADDDDTLPRAAAGHALASTHGIYHLVGPGHVDVEDAAEGLRIERLEVEGIGRDRRVAALLTRPSMRPPARQVSARIRRQSASPRDVGLHQQRFRDQAPRTRACVCSASSRLRARVVDDHARAAHPARRVATAAPSPVARAGDDADGCPAAS